MNDSILPIYAEIKRQTSVNRFKIVDANKQALAYVYGHADPRDAEIAKGLTLDEARRIAGNIAKLPTLLSRNEKGG